MAYQHKEVGIVETDNGFDRECEWAHCIDSADHGVVVDNDVIGVFCIDHAWDHQVIAPTVAVFSPEWGGAFGQMPPMAKVAYSNMIDKINNYIAS